MNDDLKPCPCPFCGGEPESGEIFNPDSYWDGRLRGEKCAYVMCEYCNVILKDYSEESAIKAWNRRAES